MESRGYVAAGAVLCLVILFVWVGLAWPFWVFAGGLALTGGIYGLMAAVDRFDDWRERRAR